MQLNSNNFYVEISAYCYDVPNKLNLFFISSNAEFFLNFYIVILNFYNVYD